MSDLAGTADRLPRGRHGLPRETVIAAQRDRILAALAAVMSEHGYVGTSVAAVIKRAGVSRETFYEQFRSKEDCFAAAYERAAELLLSRIRSGADPTAPTAVRDPGGTSDPGGRIGELLDAYLAALAAEPGYARLFLVEVYAAGPGAVARRAEMQEVFVDVVVTMLGARTESQRFACRTLVAALGALVTARVAAADPAGLLALRDPLLDLLRRGGELFGDSLGAYG